MFNLGRIDEAGFHYQQSIKNTKSRNFSERTIRTDKQQSNVLAAARNAKAKAGESLKNKQYEHSQTFYEMSNDLYSAIENRREAVEGMLLCIGGMNDVIQALAKVRPGDGGALEAKTALQVILKMQDKLSDVVVRSGLDPGFQYQCLGICLSIVASGFEATGRYTAAISRYRDSQDAYSKLTDDKQRVLRMRECVMKARHVIRALIKTLGRANSEGELTTPVKQGMNIVLQMHDSFMAASDRAKVEPTFRAENQAECLNSVGIGHYELRQFDQAETLLQRGVDIMKEKFGANCRHITLAQLLYNMGLLYQDIGQLVKARNCYEDARALYNRIEDMASRDEGMKKTQEALEDIE